MTVRHNISGTPHNMAETFSLPTESILPSPLLVVEDEPLIRNRLESILRGLRYADDALIFAQP